MRKKRILYNSNYSRLFTGFGKNTKNVLSYLAKTGKYELFEYSAQVQWSNPDLQTLPWKARGTLPDSPQEIQQLNQDPHKARAAAYGDYYIDRAVSEFKPDLLFFVEDKWGADYGINKNFWGKIPSVMWVTQDSIPLIGKDDPDKTPYYWTWSDFARKEFHRLGKKHVKTQYPLVDLSGFYNLGEQKKREIRKKFNIAEDVFIIGDTFRNQLRKLSCVNGMEGYAMFKRENPGVKSIFLFVTNFSEGWNIPELAKQYGVDMKEIWTAYVSSECNEYILHPFVGQEQKCPFTGKEKALNTVNVGKGVTEEQLNEIYNIMDVFLHAATSGACELPCVEAAAAEKIILTADYSYGEDIIELNKGAFKLDWAKYTEIGTQFIKSSPYPSSIAKQLKKVYEMTPQKRTELGRESRKWAKENYDLDVNGKKIEEFIDSLPYVDWENINLEPEQKNPNFQLPSNYREMPEDDFILMLYKEILKMDEKVGDDGYKNWKVQLANKVPREKVYEYFIKVATDENDKNRKVDFKDLLDSTGRKRGLIIVKEAIGDLIAVSSLFESFHEQYPNTDLYLMTEERYFEVLEGCPHIYKLLPYVQALEQEMVAIGAGQKECLFDVFIHPCILSQRMLGYLGLDNPLDVCANRDYNPLNLS